LLLTNIFRIIFSALLGGLVCSNISALAAEATVFTYRAAESKNDFRYEYDTNLLKLALESTVDTDGPYRLVPSPNMNYARAHLYLKSNSLPNFIIKLSYNPDFEKRGLTFAPFPVDLGIVGYRICFANPEITEQLSGVSSLKELNIFTHGQGTGWSDLEILQYNGFTVREVSSYESLFTMVAARRFDLFCRGANEFLDELTAHRHVQNLSYDKTFALFYPIPRFFYTNQANSRAMDRIHRGLMRAHENGSLLRLWLKHYKASIDFAELGKRRIIHLENPLVKGLSVDYQKYFYNPLPSR